MTNSLKTTSLHITNWQNNMHLLLVFFMIFSIFQNEKYLDNLGNCFIILLKAWETLWAIWKKQFLRHFVSWWFNPLLTDMLLDKRTIFIKEPYSTNILPVKMRNTSSKRISEHIGEVLNNDKALKDKLN